MERKNCEYCGAEFEPKHKLQKFCSKDCQVKNGNEQMRSKRAAEKVGKVMNCEYCGKEFVAKTVKSKYCSNECCQKASHEKAKEERLERKKRMKCEECGKPLGEYHSSVYCSKKCCYEATKRRLRERTKDSKPKQRRKKQPKLTIGEICRLAMEEHLTYGQYVEKYGV